MRTKLEQSVTGGKDGRTGSGCRIACLDERLPHVDGDVDRSHVSLPQRSRSKGSGDIKDLLVGSLLGLGRP